MPILDFPQFQIPVLPSWVTFTLEGVIIIVLSILGLPFFLDWLRKPSIKVEPLPNDSSIPIGRTNSVTGPDQPMPGVVLVFPTGSSPTQHASQAYFVRWKDEGESPYVLNDTRFRVKFVVLKITNEPRRLSRFRLHAGKVTTLKADLKLVEKETWGQSVEHQFQGLLEPGILSWFHDGWESGFKPLDKTPEGGKESIAKMNNFIGNPQNLLSYLRNETIDMLPLSRSAYLWLVYAMDRSPRFFHTTSGQQGRIPGKYELTVGISSADFDLREYHYRLELRDWNDFTMTRTSSLGHS